MGSEYVSLDVRCPGIREKLWSMVEKQPGPDGCWIWKGQRSRRSGRERAKSDPRWDKVGKDAKWPSPRRAAFELIKGAVVSGYLVMPQCRETMCVRPDHLRAMAVASLRKETDRRGTTVIKGRPLDGLRGENGGNSILTEAIVLDARQRYQSITTGCDALAAEYGVGRGVMYSAIAGKNWAHLNRPDHAARHSAASAQWRKLKPTRGDHHPMMKISSAQASEMLTLRAGGASYKELITRFGVSIDTVGAICRGQRVGFGGGAPPFAAPYLAALASSTPPNESDPRTSIAREWHAAGFDYFQMDADTASTFAASIDHGEDVTWPWDVFSIDAPGELFGDGITHVVVSVDGDRVALRLMSADGVVDTVTSHSGITGLRALAKLSNRNDTLVRFVVRCCGEHPRAQAPAEWRGSRTARPALVNKATGVPECRVFKIGRAVRIGDYRDAVRAYVRGTGPSPSVSWKVRMHDATYWTGKKGEQTPVKRKRGGFWVGKGKPVAVRPHRIANQPTPPIEPIEPVAASLGSAIV